MLNANQRASRRVARVPGWRARGHFPSRLSRWIRLCAAIVVTVGAGQAYALGLGGIELRSALNEKLNAEIELLEPGALQDGEILVSLAKREDFERVGVERFFFLTDLQFAVEDAPGGGKVVKITSKQVISEPYLNFLVEVLWPNGRLLKEYTLLLDPPTFSQAAAPEVTAPATDAQASRTRGTIDRSPVASSQPSEGTHVRVPQPTQRPLSRNRMADEGMTDRGDTLWEIANASRSGAVDVNQQMLAIKRLNPDAFISDNVNWLKAGFVLRMPSESDALAVASNDAASQVRRETEQWLAQKGMSQKPKTGEMVADATSGALPRKDAAQTQAATSSQPAATQSRSSMKAQVDATGATTGERIAGADSKGQLKIVAGDGDSVQGSADGGDASVAALLEEKDRLSRELEELTYQLDREQELSGNQMAVKDRQLEVKDQQIADLQSQLKTLREQAQTAQQSVAATQSQDQSADATATPWWQSGPVLGGGLAALVLALGGGLIAARRRRESDDPADVEDFVGGDFDLSGGARVEPAMMDDLDDDLGHDDDFSSAFADSLDESDTSSSFADDEALADTASEDTVALAAADPTTATPSTASGSDVIGEADIYIAYGRYPQAIGLLLGVLDEEPDRHDVRLKLVELYSETNDVDAFKTHYAELRSRCNDQAILDSAVALESQLVADNVATVDDAPTVTQLADDEPSTLDASHNGIDAAVAPVDDDFTADLTADLDDDLAGAIGDGDGSGLDDFDADFDLGGLDGDDDLNLDLGDDEPIAAQTADAPGEFELDLDDDAPAAQTSDGSEQLDVDPAMDVGMEFDDSASDGALPATDAASAESDDFDLGDLEAGSDDDAFDLGDLDADAGDEAFDLGDLDFSADGDSEDDFAGASEAVAEFDDDADFDFDSSEDSATTKLDLARAYIDMGDGDGARDILQEVLSEGNDGQQQQAKELLESI